MAHRRRRHARDATLREALDTVDAQGLVCDFPPYHPGAARESHGVVVTLPTAAGGGGGGRPHDDAVALVAPHRASTAGGEPRTQPFINWSSLPPGLDPAYGDLEGYRAQRKREQVESLARVVCGVARPGDRIVEFGAGSGHLGLVLAHLLPLCHVVLVERKAFRAGLARRRIAQAGLSNVELCAADAQQYGREAIEALYGRAERADDGSDAQPAQAAGDAGLVDRAGGTAGASGGAGPASTLLPLDEDEEPLPAGARGKPFEIGVGLHTCGLLSDVLQNVCLRLGAAYVLCPCCYGQTAGFHARSQALADALAPAQFDAVASAADFTANAEDADFVHSPPFKMAKRCMAVVDTDRQRWARMAYGYETQGFSLMPLSSSPKNNIIVGAPPLAHVLPPTPLATPQQSPCPPTGLLVQKNNSSPRPAHAALLHHRHLHDQHHRRASGGSDRGVAGGGSDDAANEFAATTTRRHRNAWSVSRKILRRVLSSTTTASTAAAATAAATTPAAAAPATHGNHVLEDDMLQHKVSLLYHHFRRFFGCGGDDGMGAGHYRGGRHIAQRDIHVVASPPTGHRLRVRFGLRRFPDSGGGLQYAEFHNGALSKPVSSCPAAAPAIQAAMPVLLAALGECSDVGAAAEAEAAAAADCRRELARQAARAYAGDGNPDADAAAGVAAVVEVVLGGSCRGSSRSRHGVAAGLGALSAPARKVCRRLQQRRERLTAFGRAHAHLAEGLQAVHFLSTLAGDLLATLVYNRRLDGPPPSVTSHAAAAVGEGDGAAGGPSETSSWYASALALSRRVGFDLVGRSRGQVVTVSGAGVRGAGDRGGDGGGAAGPREGNYVEECFELRPPQRSAQGAADTKDGQQRAPRQLRYRQVEGSFSNPNGVVNVRVLEWLSAVVGEFAGPAAEGGAAQDTAAGAAEEGAGQQEMSLLEIYCGCGNHTVALAPLFAHTTAIELNSHLASVCELNLSRNGMRKRVEVRQADSQRVCTQLLRATRASPREDRLRAQANAEAAAAMAAARTAASAAGTPAAEVSSGGGPSGASGGGGAAFFNALASPMPSPTAQRGSGAGGGAQHRPVKLWGRDYHCCLVDPPRAGLDPSTLAVVQRFPRVLYISCNPDSLYRDLRLLASTHAVRRFAVFDHFPGTRFVESGVFLERLGE